MFCCPIMKTITALAATCCLGYGGYQASLLYMQYQELSKPGCCPNSRSRFPVTVPESESECSSEQEACETGCLGGASTSTCCKSTSRAATIAKSCTSDVSCCEEAITASTITTVIKAAPEAEATADGWATIRGQIVFSGDNIPTPAECKVTSDQGHCLAKGALYDKVWDVNPSNKGVRGVVVFILPERDEKLPIHPDYQSDPKPFVLDQPYCEFTPRIFAIRSNQTLVAKNPDPISHNVVVKGIRNDQNVQIPPDSEKQLKLTPETNALAISCGSHPWMKGYGWCFDHPYFAVTDKDGKFEIPSVPAGSRKIVIWHETGFLKGYGKRDNKTLNLSAGASLDLGTVSAGPN
ncbi:MAG TPA: carboxypeptidase regulatory-like domain-containing protein [Gemmatales bacterium]|nr:carboxypeptidase regulatory-like domain-containing protein [Gemmatales bacterium]